MDELKKEVDLVSQFSSLKHLLAKKSILAIFDEMYNVLLCSIVG